MGGITLVATLIGIGLSIGVISGMVGIGGGVLVIPVLMVGFGFAQEKANGTSLAMLLPPVGLFAVLSYWKAGNIDLKFAGLMALGFAGGALIGAYAVNAKWINPTILRLLFALLLVYVATRMLAQTSFRGGWPMKTLLALGCAAISLWTTRRTAPPPAKPTPDSGEHDFTI